jgi:hypothetical protein
MNEAPDFISHPSFPGLLGALIAALIGLKFMPGQTWAERCAELVARLFSFLAGSAIAWYGAPALIEVFSIKTDGLAAAACFSVGLVGFSLAKAIISGIKEVKFGEIFSGWLNSLGSGSGPKGP